MNSFKKIKLVVSGIILLSAALSTKSAEAFTNETCTVGTVWYAPANISPINASGDMLIIGCTNDNTNYYLAVGSPIVANGCYTSIDAIKALEVVALTARASGKTLTIPYYPASCPGVGSVRVFSELGL
jgi:hypothetical protein